MKKKIIFITLLFYFVSCTDNRQIIKEIITNDIGQHKLVTLCWYRKDEAYVSLKENDSDEENLLTCNDGAITDVDLKNDTIFIKIFHLKQTAIYKKRTSLGKYIIKLEESTYEEWFKHYHPGEKFHAIKGL